MRLVRVWGSSTSPTAHALAGRRCEPWGWRKGVPGGDLVRRCEGHLGSGAPPHPAARPLGGLPGPTTHWLRVRGGAGVGTRHQPHSARLCELALRAVGAGRGRPGAAPPAWVWGVPGQALPHPRLPALWAGCRGPLPTGCGCGGIWAWGPVTNPTARALACCGGGTRAPGGAPLAWAWRVRGRALSQPRLPALWAGCRGPLPTGCGCKGVRASGPVIKPTARAPACCGSGMRVPGGGASCLVVACAGLGALPLPTARSLGRLLGPTTHWLRVRGDAGVGTRHQPHSARSCELALRAVGAA